jgi:hypothetical protein
MAKPDAIQYDKDGNEMAHWRFNPSAPKQEPVKWSDYEPNGMQHNKPSQRTWVGLTDEERNDLCYDFGEKSLWSFADSIEAKLKQKNGYAEEKKQ